MDEAMSSAYILVRALFWVLLLFLPHSAKAVCDSGWLGTEAIGSCFYFEETTEQTHDAALTYCQGLRQGAFLARLETQAMFDYVQDNLPDHSFWKDKIRHIDGNDNAEEGTWRWSDGTLMGYADHEVWSNTDPNGDTGENCNGIANFGNGWIDIPCGWEQRAVCQYTIDNCDSPFQGSSGLSSCFHVDVTPRTNEEAMAHCEGLREGASLARPKTREEIDFLHTLMPADTFVFVDGNDRIAEGTWKWGDGTAMVTHLWSTGEPNNAGAGEHCNGLRMGLGFVDLPCAQPFPFACQYEVEVECPPTSVIGTQFQSGNIYFVETTADFVGASAAKSECDGARMGLASVATSASVTELLSTGFSEFWVDLHSPTPTDCEGTGAECDAQVSLTDLGGSAVSIAHVTKFKCDKCEKDTKQCFKFKDDNGNLKLEGKKCSESRQAVCRIECAPSVNWAECPSSHVFSYSGHARCCDANTEGPSCGGGPLYQDTSTCCSGSDVACTGGDLCRDAKYCTAASLPPTSALVSSNPGATTAFGVGHEIT